MELTILWYLIPSLLMFCCGVYGFITRKNMIAMLFNRFLFPGELEGMFFTLFAIALAAAETALAIAIIINVFRVSEKIDVDDVTKMKF